uniref:(northern house mosquito) hypothetical protein n=1 Tax=Culex pipiens TaxID=7175 RepID=A0A8D8FYM0_CULPI
MEGSSSFVYSTLHHQDSSTQSLSNSRTGSPVLHPRDRLQVLHISSALSLTTVENYTHLTLQHCVFTDFPKNHFRRRSELSSILHPVLSYIQIDLRLLNDRDVF